jgi:ribose transport system ATP-binding protein
MNEVVLSVEHLTKRFAGLVALDDVSIEIGAHQVVGLVGENGAGKSTLLKILAGLFPPDGGRIILRGKPVSLHSVAAAADAGIGMVFQEQSLLPNISVAENILLAHEGAAVRKGMYNWSKLHELASVQLDKLGSKIHPAAPTDSLSFTERQVVEMAKVLAIEERTRHEPIVLLDEPTSVFESGEIETLFAQIKRLRERASVVFVSHRLDEVLRVSDRIYVMTNGRCVAERNPRDCDLVELQQLMLGRELIDEYSKKTVRPTVEQGAVRLSVRKLRRAGKYEEVTFDLHDGEVLGIAGVQGSGREALCRTLFGAEEADGGGFLIDDVPVRFGGPRDAVRSGVGYLPSERRVEGVIGGLNVRENMTLAHLGEMMRGFVVDRKREKHLARRWIERLRIKTKSTETSVAELSGGNQQKVALTKWLVARSPKILILDHPMRGLDVGAKAEIFTLIRELAEGGIGILLIADTLDELIALSDTIIVMRDGRISARFPASKAPPTQLQILEWMV